MNEQLTVDQCYASLRNVIDPELYQNIVDLGLVYGVEVGDANHVAVTMTLTTPHCPMGPQILADVDKFLRADGASAVDIQIVWQPMWTPAMMSAQLGPCGPGVERIGRPQSSCRRSGPSVGAAV